MADGTKLHHVAVVTADIDSALAFWRDALGLEPSGVKFLPEQKSKIAFLPLGSAEIELVQPADPDSGIGKYLSKRGPGMHHLCLEVRDFDGAVGRLKAKGIRLTSEAPMTGADGRRMIFVHPESAGGVLVELYEGGEFAEKP
ncbi:MAG: methylmalonyl-CoA epimerase [Anaerolineales bacterium]|nr:methylmalonyl-CoA epimerase [Anaerolineales bacterium]